METNKVLLADLVAPDAEYQSEDPWELVYNIFRNRGSAQLAGMLIRRAIARRWYDEEGIDPSTEMVEMSTTTPPGPLVLPVTRSYRIRGHEVTAAGGQITLLALENAFGTNRLENLAAEVSDEAREIGEAAALQVQAEAFAERVPQVVQRVRGSFADARLGEVEAFKRQVETARDHAGQLSRHAPASSFVGGLDATIGTHATSLTMLVTDIQTWRTAHPRDITASESAQQRAVTAMSAQQELLDQGHYLAAAAWGESANANSMSMALIDLFGGHTQRDIAVAYDRGEISYNEMEDLQHCAAVRTAAVGIVTIALAIATAGIGSTIVGGLGLAAEGTLTFSMLSLGIEGGLVNVGSMGAEHFLASQREFANPAAQAIWGRGAYSAEQYGMGFALGFGMGGVFGASNHFLFPPPAGAGGLSLLEGGPTALATTGESRLARFSVPSVERPPFDVLSAVNDATFGTRTVRLRMADGELVTIVGHPETGTGYLLRGNGEMFNIVDGQIAGRSPGLLGPGSGMVAPSAAEPTLVFEGSGGTIHLTTRSALLEMPRVPQLLAGGYRPQSPNEAMQLWGDPRWAGYGGHWVMRDASTGERLRVWQIDELMAAERHGAAASETQVRYQLPAQETFSGRPGAQSEVILDIARTGRQGPLPSEGAVLTEIKHRDFTLPGLGRMQALDTAGSLQRMYRVAGIEVRVNSAAGGATFEVITSQSLSSQTHNLIMREFARWLLRQGLSSTEVTQILGRIRWATQRPFRIQGGTVFREP